MKKTILTVYLGIISLLIFAQRPAIEIPVEIEKSGNEVVGYRHPDIQDVFVDVQQKNGIYRNKFLYAYSKFSMEGFQSSSSNNVSSFIDKLIDDGKLDKLNNRRTACFEIGDHVYVCQFIKSEKKFRVSSY